MTINTKMERFVSFIPTHEWAVPTVGIKSEMKWIELAIINYIVKTALTLRKKIRIPQPQLLSHECERLRRAIGTHSPPVDRSKNQMNEQICAAQLGDFLTRPQLLQPTTRQQFAWQNWNRPKFRKEKRKKQIEMWMILNVKLRAQMKQATNAQINHRYRDKAISSVSLTPFLSLSEDISSIPLRG